MGRRNLVASLAGAACRRAAACAAAALPLAALLLLALPTDAGAQLVVNMRVLEDAGDGPMRRRPAARIIPEPGSRAGFSCSTQEPRFMAVVPAQPGTDFASQQLSYPFADLAEQLDSDGSLPFVLRVEADDIVEAHEVFRLVCRYGLADEFNGGVITIHDNDFAEVSVAPVLPFPGPGGQTVREEAGPVEFEVTLSNPVATTVTVDYAVAEGDDASPANDDIMDTSGTLTFMPGETSKTITVTPIDDDIAEGVESFTVALSNLAGSPRPGAVSLGTATATAIIRANDMSTGLSVEGGSAREGDGVTFTVRRGGPAPLPELTVTWTAAATGTAAADDFVDLAAATGTATVPQGSRAATFRVMTADDDVAEGEETFTVTLSNPADPADSSAVIDLRTATATGRILPSDTATALLSPAGGVRLREDDTALFTVQLSHAVQEPVTVEYAVGGFCLPGGVAPVPPGGHSRCNTEAFPTDIVGGMTNGFATGPVLTGTLEFAPGDMEQTFSVRTVADDVTTGDRTFDVSLSASDPLIAVHARDSQATVTIIEDDVTTLSVVPVGGSVEVVEGATIDFDVILTGGFDRGILTVRFPDFGPGTAVRARSAGDPGDFRVTSDPVTVSIDPRGRYDNHRVGTIRIETVDDERAEADETFTVRVAPATGAQLPFDRFRRQLGGVILGATTVTIRDSDTMTVVSGPDDAGAEEGDGVMFTVGVEDVPGQTRTEALTLTYAVTPETAAADDFPPGFATGTVTIPPDAASATFTIMTAEDTDAEEDETFTVRLTAPDGVRLDGGTATGTIRNDDADLAAPVRLTIPDFEVSEGDPITFALELSRAHNEDLRLEWALVLFDSTADITDLTDTPGGLQGEITIPAGDTSAEFAYARAADDAVGEPSETIVVDFTPLSGDAGVELVDENEFMGITATATILDNDGGPAAAAVMVSLEGGSRVSEGLPASFTVRLSAPAPAPFTLPWVALDPVAWNAVFGAFDTASTTDITPRTGTVAVDTGDTEVPFMIGTVADDVREQDETFSVRLLQPAGGLPDGVGFVQPDFALGDREAVRAEPRVTAMATILEVNTAPGTPQVTDQQIPPETAFVYQIAEVSDLNGHSVTWSAALSDGGALPAWLTFTARDRTFRGTPGFADVDTFTVRVTATDDGEPPQSAFADFTITVGELAAVRLGRVNEELLPHAAQAMAAGTVEAISGRIEAAANGSSGQAGMANLLQALKSGERGLESGTTDLERVLGGSSLVMALNAAEDGGPRAGDLAVWGSGDYRNLSGPDDGAMDWDGDMFSFHLGTDVRLRRELLAGVAVSRSRGSFDYTDRTRPLATEGDYEIRMTGVHPYVSWAQERGPRLWATAGWGRGEIRITEADEAGADSVAEMTSAAVGGSFGLLDGSIGGGTATLRLKGEGTMARIEAEGGAAIRPAEFDVRRLRAVLEGGYECLAGAYGKCLAPSVEVGMRHDGGDARTGTGVEVGGGLRFTDRATGLTLEGRGRALVADEDGYGDWGVGGLIRLEPGDDGNGLSFSLTPGFGNVSSGAGRLYDEGLAGSAAAADPEGRLGTEIGYGFLEGVLTPHIGMSLADGGSRSYRVGSRLRLGSTFSMSLEGQRRSSIAAKPDHGVTLRSRLSW